MGILLQVGVRVRGVGVVVVRRERERRDGEVVDLRRTKRTKRKKEQVRMIFRLIGDMVFDLFMLFLRERERVYVWKFGATK